MSEIKRDEKGRIAAGSGAINAGGRPKAIKEALEAFRNEHDLANLRNRLIELAMGEDGRTAIAAIKEFHDRAYGKAPQAIVDENGKSVAWNVVVMPSEK